MSSNAALTQHFCILFTAMLLGSFTLIAQQRNELLGHINGPVSILEYDGIDHTSALDDGVGFGIEYGRYLSPQWSLRTGVALQNYSGHAELDRITGAYATQDAENEDFEFRYQFANYRETQQASYIQVPLLLQYESSGNARFFASAGVKVGVLVSSEYEAQAAQLNTAGYYEQYDVLLEAPRFAGFADFCRYSWSSDALELKTNVMLSLETGLKVPVTGTSPPYISVYLDYGLTNIFDEETTNRLVDYNAAPEVNFTGNSILTTSAANLSEVKTLSFGFKLKYGLQF